MTVLRWIASRCAVVTRLKPHSHQATSVCLRAPKSFSLDNSSGCDRMKRVRAAVLAESSSWRTRMCEISVTSMPVLFPVSRRASFASPQEAAKAAGRRDHPDLLCLRLAVGRAVHQPGPTQAAAVELRDLSAASARTRDHRASADVARARAVLCLRHRDVLGAMPGGDLPVRTIS